MRYLDKHFHMHQPMDLNGNPILDEVDFVFDITEFAVMIYNKKYETLYIDIDVLVPFFEKYFSITQSHLEKLLAEWVNDKLGYKIDDVRHLFIKLNYGR